MSEVGYLQAMPLRAAMTGAPSEQSVLEAVPSDLLIDGEWRGASGGGRLAVEDPATGKSLIEIADVHPRGRPCSAGRRRPGNRREWAAHRPRERGEILRRAYEAIVAQTEELALLMTLEMGKSLAGVALGDRLCRRVLALVRRGGRADPRPLQATTPARAGS